MTLAAMATLDLRGLFGAVVIGVPVPIDERGPRRGINHIEPHEVTIGRMLHVRFIGPERGRIHRSLSAAARISQISGGMPEAGHISRR